MSSSELKNIPRDQFDIKQNTHLNIVLNFLEDQVFNFASTSQFSKEEFDEESINEELAIHLNRECVIESLPIHFHSEPRSDNSTNKKGKNPAVDLGIILARRNADKKTVFDIEAKRLRTPPSNSKQYVSGKTGGIERFKREFHGKGLAESAIVGYVEGESFEFWFKKINEWIGNLVASNSDSTITWKNSELLNKSSFSADKAKCNSINIRSKKPIRLHHFWVKIISN